MPCLAYLYEDSIYGARLAPLQAPAVELIAATRKHKNLDVKSNRPLGPDLWGAELVFSPQPIPYYILVFDHSRRYAPTFMGDLNGVVSGRFDIVVWPLPFTQPSAGVRPLQFLDIGPFIDAQHWSPAEKIGARLLVEGLSAANAGEISVPEEVLEGWFQRAHHLWIDPRLVSLHPGAHRWAIADYTTHSVQGYAAGVTATGSAAAGPVARTEDERVQEKAVARFK